MPRRPRRAWTALPVIAATALLAACSAAPPGPPSASAGNVVDRPVPAFALVDQDGRPSGLDPAPGRVVVVVPTLTLCQEMCPLSTADLLVVERSLQHARLAGRVAIVEYSVDPGRDTPARLRAYRTLTGADWTFLTGTPATIGAVDQFLGVFAQRVPEPTPPGTDWMTGKPLTYDVNHTDGFFLLDARGHERFATGASPEVPGHKVPTVLRRMLDTTGLQNLNAPQGPNWTPADMLAAIGWMVGRQIPLAP